MTRDQAQAAFNSAFESYGAAKQRLADARWCAAHGMGAANLAFYEMQAHTKLAAMVRAHAAVAKFDPPATVPAKPAVATTVPTPVPAKATASNTGSFDLLGYFNDQCRESEVRMWGRLGMPAPAREP